MFFGGRKVVQLAFGDRCPCCCDIFFGGLCAGGRVRFGAGDCHCAKKSNATPQGRTVPQARKKGVEEPGATPQKATRPNAQRKWCPERQEKVLLTKKRSIVQNTDPGGLRLILERVGGEGVAAGEPKSVVVESDTHGAVEGEEDGKGGDGSLVLATFEDIPTGSEASRSLSPWRCPQP